MIVEAVGICVVSLDPGKADYCTRLHAAMVKAVEEAIAEGVDINDSVTMKARIDAVRVNING